MKGKGFLISLSLLLLLCGVAQAAKRTASADGVFTDVPRGHWAYEAVKKATESGILQGYDGKFHGSKTINRYQMGLIVARMLEKVGRGGDAARNLSEQDLQNLEALTIEFADELALLNVKVSTLEDSFAELKHDVEAIKTGGNYGGHHAKGRNSAGLHGVTGLRLVLTDAGGPNAAVGQVGTTQTPLTRYSGDVVGAVVGSQTFTSRTFFTIPQLSLSVDREIDEGIGIHLQLDINADIANNQNQNNNPFPSQLPGGNGDLQVNEAYIDVDDLFYGIGARMGGFALPVSREYNGTHRTLDYTITPGAVSLRLETYRPVGVEFRNQDDIIRWDWRLAVFSGLDGGANTNVGFPTPNLINGILVPSMCYAMMKSQAGFTNIPYTDVPWGLTTDAVATEVTGFGYFARVGDQPDEGFGWDINYLANGGNITPSNTKRMTASDFSWIVGTLDYYWKYFDIIVQAYSGQTKNTATTGQITNANADAVSSLGVYGLFNYRFDPDNNLTLRYEQNTDDVKSIGKVDVLTLTVGYNRIISDHSLFQLEYLAPTAKYTAATPLIAGSQASNSTDNKDTLIQANYKLKW